MSINKSIFSFLVFGLLLQACGSDTPEVKSNAEVVTQSASRELADAKVDASIGSVTPSELETEEAKAEAARQAKAEEAKARKIAADEAREAKEKARKEKRAKAREERRKKASEARRKKRRAKRKAARLAAEKAAKEKAELVENERPIPVEYHSAPINHSASQAGGGAPLISFYNTVHNYGTIEQGDKVEYKFKFKNVGKSELVVVDASASCGCTKPSYPFIPIEPGEEGYIGVTFDSKGKLGRQKPSVVITTNADPATYTIYLEGYVDSADKKEEASNDNDEEDKKSKDGKSF